jgi:threonyl-tRNA synthetase
MAKVPYMLVMGGREVEQGTVAVRSRVQGDLGAMKLEDVVCRMTEEVAGKVIVESKGTANESATRR